MKKYIFFLILLPKLIHSQTFTIPNFELENKTDSIHTYIDFLDIKDKKALILKYNITNAYKQPKITTYLVFENSGKLFRYEALSYLKDKFSVEKNEIFGNEKKIYQNMLVEIYSKKMLEINKDSLENKTIYDEKGKETIFEFFDSNKYELEIIRGNQYLKFNAYAVEDYISENSLGKRDKQNFLNLIHFIDKKNSQTRNKDLEFLISQASNDTIYIQFEKNKNLSKRVVDYSSSKNDPITRYSFKINSLFNFFLLRRENSPSKDTKGNIPYYSEKISKSFLNKRDKIDIKLLKKYHLYVYFYMINKKIFVLEKVKGDLFKKEVQLRL